MTDRLKQALDHAGEAGKLYGLNIVGNTLSIVEQAVGYADEGDEVSGISWAWQKYGDDLLREDRLGCVGHMSDRDIGVMGSECKELAEVVTEECDTLEEIREALKAKE
jgi:hypothetical protein